MTHENCKRDQLHSEKKMCYSDDILKLVFSTFELRKLFDVIIDD